MGKKILKCGSIEIKKKSLPSLNCYSLKYVDTDKVLVSKKISFIEKNYNYFIGYLYNDNNVKPLHILFPKSSYDRQTKWMYF